MKNTHVMLYQSRTSCRGCRCLSYTEHFASCLSLSIAASMILFFHAPINEKSEKQSKSKNHGSSLTLVESWPIERSTQLFLWVPGHNAIKVISPHLRPCIRL